MTLAVTRLILTLGGNTVTGLRLLGISTTIGHGGGIHTLSLRRHLVTLSRGAILHGLLLAEASTTTTASITAAAATATAEATTASWAGVRGLVDSNRSSVEPIID